MTAKNNQKIKRGIILIFLSSLMFGTYGVWSKLIGDSFGSLYQAWTRAAIIFLILLPILYFTKQIVHIQKKDWKWMTIFLIFTSGTQAPIFYAFNHMDIGTATLLFFTTMLLTMYIVGFVFLKEKLSKIKIVSFLTAVAGLYFMFFFSLEKFTLLAALMAVLNGIASGGEVSISKKLTNSYSALYLTALSWLIIVPTNGLISLMIGEKQIVPSLTLVWVWQLCYTITALLAFWLIIEGLKYVEASIGGLIGLLEIIFSIGFGIIIFGEKLTPKIAIGATLILLAASLPHLKQLSENET